MIMIPIQQKSPLISSPQISKTENLKPINPTILLSLLLNISLTISYLTIVRFPSILSVILFAREFRASENQVL